MEKPKQESLSKDPESKDHVIFSGKVLKLKVR